MDQKLHEKSLREQIAGKCIHFNGTVNEKCDAGIKYSDVRLYQPQGDANAGRRLPCLRDYCDGTLCVKREWPSKEYIQARLDEIEARNKRMMLAWELIARIKQEHKGESWQGVEKCPACGGELHLSISGYNGHVWGRCKTENCLAWME